MDILVWNVCKIGNKSSIEAANNLVYGHKPLILVLIEPKVSRDWAIIVFKVLVSRVSFMLKLRE